MDGYFLAMFQIAFGKGVGFNVGWSAKRRKMRSKMGVIATNIPKPGVIAKNRRKRRATKVRVFIVVHAAYKQVWVHFDHTSMASVPDSSLSTSISPKMEF